MHSSNFCICSLAKIFASWQLFARGQLGAGHQITKVCRLASFFIIRLANKYKYSYISVSDGMLVRGFSLTQHISLEGMTVLKWGLELARKAAAGCPSFAQRGIPIGCEPAQVIGWSLPLLWASLPSQADLIIYILKFLIDVERKVQEEEETKTISVWGRQCPLDTHPCSCKNYFFLDFDFLVQMKQSASILLHFSTSWGWSKHTYEAFQTCHSSHFFYRVVRNFKQAPL